MKGKDRILCSWLVMMFCIVHTSCVPHQNAADMRNYVDSLNSLSYSYRYKDLKESGQTAQLALNAVRQYEEGQAEALNHLGFVAFMHMDFERADSLYNSVYTITDNEVERLIADVGMMKICQRTSLNKEFYDYRNSALHRINRINDDFSALNGKKRLLTRYNYARSEFYIVLGIYYYYLQQNVESMSAINSVEYEWIRDDDSQQLYYNYMRGSGGMYEAESEDNITLGEFDLLLDCYIKARTEDYIYFEANALQGMAELLNVKHNRLLIEQKAGYLHRLVNEDNLPVDSIPLYCARKALDLFTEYDDWYQISGTYRTIATYYNIEQQPTMALACLEKALDYVNRHHCKFYAPADSMDILRTYNPYTNESLELKWVEDPAVKTVPEWIVRMREQLSITYSAMDHKVESDYNRNMYLDILDYTRQDKELENRYELLEKETSMLNLLILLIVVGACSFIVLFWILNKYWKKRNAVYMAELRKILVMCRQITSSIPAEAVEIDEVVTAIIESVRNQLHDTFRISQLDIYLSDKRDDACSKNSTPGNSRQNIQYSFSLWSSQNRYKLGIVEVLAERKLKKDELSMFRLLLPYIAWTIENGINFVSLDGERRNLEKEQYVHQLHLVENKRNNIVRKACVAIVTGMLPYIDRVVNEVNKLKAVHRNDEHNNSRLEYIDELTARINELNDILTLWIKMRQGSLSLKIENFRLDELFSAIEKARYAFDLRQQSLTVESVKVMVKADKSLTLFMINTLLENARKYTPEGGQIQLIAFDNEDYVEISVGDNGPGISQEDIHHILGEKVYDSEQIGMSTTMDTARLKEQKGSGFGLMNCKGIVEKYRKMNPIFSVCKFGIDSTVGKGSRFFFRLPKGTHLMGMLLCIVSLVFTSCRPSSYTPEEIPASKQQIHSMRTDVAVSEYDSLLCIANGYTTKMYEANVKGHYEDALIYADSAITYMNMHYTRYSGQLSPLINLYTHEGLAEQNWYASGFDTDYYILLDVRNEVAVACLAQKDFLRYSYNNLAYTSLYKQISEDNHLGEYCRVMQQSANNKIIAITLFIMLLVIAFVIYYVLYLRRSLNYRYNIEQVFTVNDAILSASMVAGTDGSDMLGRIIADVYPKINEMIAIDNLCISVYDEESMQLVHQAYRDIDNEEILRVVKEQYAAQQSSPIRNNLWLHLPLWIDGNEHSGCIGYMSMHLLMPNTGEEDLLLIELIASYMSVVIYNAVVKVNRKQHDIELAQDEARRVVYEENKIHVQNMVLDNCLSTIKHETIYYPNRIRQIVRQMLDHNQEPADYSHSVETIAELVTYYKYILSLLTSCASRQLDDVVFRRSFFSSDEVTEHARRYFLRQVRKIFADIHLKVSSQPLTMMGDVHLIKFLMENLIDESLRYIAPGDISLSVVEEKDYVRFDFTDTRRTYSQSMLNQIFYPDRQRMFNAGDGHTLQGTEYLVCKQIIREHDEYSGRRGCRINAIIAHGGKGFTVWFTIPIKK